VDNAPLYVGQSIGLIHDIPTCAELLDRMVTEAGERINAAREKIGVA